MGFSTHNEGTKSLTVDEAPCELLGRPTRGPAVSSRPHPHPPSQPTSLLFLQQALLIPISGPLHLRFPVSAALSLGLSKAGSFLSLKSRLECHLPWEDPLATQSEGTHHHPGHSVSHPMFLASVTAGTPRLTICYWPCSDVGLLGGLLVLSWNPHQELLNTSPSVTYSAVPSFYR